MLSKSTAAPDMKCYGVACMKGGFFGAFGERGVGGSKCGATCALVLVIKVIKTGQQHAKQQLECSSSCLARLYTLL